MWRWSLPPTQIEAQPPVTLIDELMGPLVTVDQMVMVPAEQAEPSEIGASTAPPWIEVVALENTKVSRMATTNTTRRAAIYCRISDDKTGEALGVERQRKDCDGLARTSGFASSARSSTTSSARLGHKRRPEWNRLVDAIKDGTIDVVVCATSGSA